MFICLTSFCFKIWKSSMSGSCPTQMSIFPCSMRQRHHCRCWSNAHHGSLLLLKTRRHTGRFPRGYYFGKAVLIVDIRIPWVSLYGWGKGKATLLLRAGVKEKPTRNLLVSAVMWLPHTHLTRQQNLGGWRTKFHTSEEVLVRTITHTKPHTHTHPGTPAFRKGPRLCRRENGDGQ